MTNTAITTLHIGHGDPIFSSEKGPVDERTDPVYQLRACGRERNFSRAMEIIKAHGLSISNSMLVYTAGVREIVYDKAGNARKVKKGGAI